MKAVILAGGFGTRLSEETAFRPKPMVEIGGKPILWHIMHIYAVQGITEFIITLGYKAEIIKEYFLNFYAINNDLTVDLATGEAIVHGTNQLPWTVHLIDTGMHTLTGGRVKRLEPWLKDGTFMVTYGDGVCDIDLADLLRFHRSHGRIATVTAVRPPARFGGLIFDGDLVADFTEKPQIGEGWINGGFMVFEPEVFNYLSGDDSSLEANGLEGLAADQQLCAYKHDRFWQCMDTMRDMRLLESYWQSGDVPWKVWE